MVNSPALSITRGFLIGRPDFSSCSLICSDLLLIRYLSEAQFEHLALIHLVNRRPENRLIFWTTRMRCRAQPSLFMSSARSHCQSDCRIGLLYYGFLSAAYWYRAFSPGLAISQRCRGLDSSSGKCGQRFLHFSVP